MGNFRFYFINLYKTSVYNFSRTIMTTQNNLEKSLEKLQKNPYYEKYADRIAELQKTAPEKFLQHVDKQHKATEEERKKKIASLDTRQFSSVLNPKSAVQQAAPVDNDKLDAIFKTDLVKDKTGEEIQAIWEEYHRNKEVISAVIPAEVYWGIHQQMRAHPTFVFPLPRDHGYEFVLSQCLGHAAHFTPLLAYQVHAENAPECLKVSHYTELADRGVVLMRGEYDKKVLSGAEARCLANQFQLYYGAGAGGRDPARAALLGRFSDEPDSFRHMDLVAQLETIALP